jgi:hypothetical protein
MCPFCVRQTMVAGHLRKRTRCAAIPPVEDEPIAGESARESAGVRVGGGQGRVGSVLLFVAGGPGPPRGPARSRPDERAPAELAVVLDPRDGEADLELGEERAEHVPDARLPAER